jgi:hypothetical protein
MLDFPEPVLNYLLDYFVENRSPGYLLIDNDGYLLTWGGKLERYGITRLQKGELIGKQIHFLDGLLPLNNSPELLTNIKTELGVVVDLHIFSESDGDWVLFLDATENEIERRMTQQKLNDLRLLLEKKQKS